MAENLLNSSLMDQAEEALLKPLFEPIQSIFIDADFLYDYRLGALILNTSTPEEYKYILDNIHAYEEGKSRSIVKYFPNLGLTDEKVDLTMNDYGWADIVHSAAPKTKFLADLPVFIARINTFNRTKMITNPLRLTINDRHSPMPDAIWNQLVGYIRSQDPVVRIEHTNYTSWFDIDAETIENMSMILVHDLVDFMADGTESQRLLRSGKLMDKVILTPYQTEDDYDDPEKETAAIVNFTSVMMTYTNEFSFVKKSIQIGK